jgi:hypothetical protein
MGSFMGKTKIYYEFKRKNVNCYSCPAYRATLLPIRWVQVNSALTFLFQSVSGLTEPIPNFAKFSGRKVGLRTRKSDKSLGFPLLNLYLL